MTTDQKTGRPGRPQPPRGLSNHVSNDRGRQWRTPVDTDDVASQVRHTVALTVCRGSWLWEHEASGLRVCYSRLWGGGLPRPFGRKPYGRGATRRLARRTRRPLAEVATLPVTAPAPSDPGRPPRAAHLLAAQDPRHLSGGRESSRPDSILPVW
jgi:hypothetical protein